MNLRWETCPFLDSYQTRFPSEDEFFVSNLNSAIVFPQFHFSVIIRPSQTRLGLTIIRKVLTLWNGHLHAINCENIAISPFRSAVNNI